MFKKYKMQIEELNAKNNDLKYTLAQKEEQITRLHEECLRLRDVINAKVEDCKVGPWCLTCDHYRTDTSQKVWGAVINANSNVWVREPDDKDGTIMYCAKHLHDLCPEHSRGGK